MSQPRDSDFCCPRSLQTMLILTALVNGLMAEFFWSYASSTMIGLAHVNASPFFFGSAALPALTTMLVFRPVDR